MTWTPELDAQCEALIDEGLSAAQIAVQLGLISRGAVIGRAHRKGWQLQRPSRGPTLKLPQAVRLHRLSFSAVTGKPLPSKSPTPKQSRRPYNGPSRTLLELRDCDCHWPVGDAPGSGLLYCGDAVARVRYCATHADAAARKAIK